jgi:hypothetical protein
MENRLICIQGGMVANVIVCDDDFAQTLGFDQILKANDVMGPVHPGMKYENGVFLMPPDETHTDWWAPNIPVTRL